MYHETRVYWKTNQEKKSNETEQVNVWEKNVAQTSTWAFAALGAVKWWSWLLTDVLMINQITSSQVLQTVLGQEKADSLMADHWQKSDKLSPTRVWWKLQYTIIKCCKPNFSFRSQIYKIVL